MRSSVPLCPYIRLAWYDVLRPGTDIPLRRIFDYELMYIKGGRAEIFIAQADGISDQTYIATAGDLFFFRPHQQHSIRILDDAPLIQPHIHFDLEYEEKREVVPVSLIDEPSMTPGQRTFFRRDISSSFFEHFPSRLRPRTPVLFEHLFFDTIYAYDNPGVFNEIRLQSLFLLLWHHLLSEITFSTQPSAIRCKENDMEMVKMYIEHNLNRRLSLDELSEVAHYSKCYLLCVFKEAFQLTPTQYHTARRIEKAKEMMMYTNLTLQQIADELGFSSPQDFSRFFRRNTGEAPSTFRLNHPHFQQPQTAPTVHPRMLLPEMRR